MPWTQSIWTERKPRLWQCTQFVGSLVPDRWKRPAFTRRGRQPPRGALGLHWLHRASATCSLQARLSLQFILDCSPCQSWFALVNKCHLDSQNQLCELLKIGMKKRKYEGDTVLIHKCHSLTWNIWVGGRGQATNERMFLFQSKKRRRRRHFGT